MNRDKWSAGLLAREAGANITAAQSRLRPLAVAAVLLGSAAVSFGAWEDSSFRDELALLRQAGRNVVVIAPVSDTNTDIGRAGCEALADQPGIERAGMVWPAGHATSAQLGVSLPLMQVSTTLIPEVASSDVLIGSALASSVAFGSRALARETDPDATVSANWTPDRITLGSDTTVTAQLLPEQPVGVDLNAAIIAAAPANMTAGPRCVVVVSDTENARERSGSLTASLSAAGGPIAAQPAMDNVGDAVATHTTRPTRLVPLVAGLCLGLVCAIAVRGRSQEFAAYGLSGTSPRSLALLASLEAAGLAGCFSFAGVLAAAALAGSELDPAAAAAWALAGGCAAQVAAAAGTSYLACASPLRLSKE